MLVSIFKGHWRGIGEQAEQVTYAKIGVRFRDHLHLFSGAKLHVFLAIILHMDENGVAYPSYDKLEQETGYGRGTIAKALDDLCQLQIEGKRVLCRYRERDEKQRYTGSNRYLIFPSQAEVQSLENPTLEKANSGKGELEEVPVVLKKNQREKKAPPQNDYSRYLRGHHAESS